MTIPREYRAEHLFVLVGTNPLPNVVAIRLLMPETGCVYFLYTATTSLFVDRIIQAGHLPPAVTVKRIMVDEEKGAQIEEKVASAAAGKSSLGLNYTGGTKHMVLHAYEAVRNAAQALKVQPVLSYLNARTLTMRVEQIGRQANTYQVATSVQLTIDELLNLHGNPRGAWNEQPIKTPVYEVLAQLPPGDLTKWYQRARQGKNLEQQREIPLPDFGELLPFWDGLTTIGDLAEHWHVSMHDLSKWFAGHWLEHYTLTAIQQVAVVCDIHASAMNLETRGFEFDVIAIKGYQLFALSCVTQHDKSTLKQKLFEAYIRARQMGGDEARTAIVCHAPRHGDASPQRIEDEVKRSWDAEGKVRVFGEAHLPNLSMHLANWFGR